MRKFKPRKKRFTFAPSKKKLLLISFLLLIFFTALSIYLINSKIKPILMDIAETKTTEFATRAINSAVKFAEEYTIDDITRNATNESGNASIVDWDVTILNKINREATDRVETYFHNVNNGIPLNDEEFHRDNASAEEVADSNPNVVEIPLGQVTGNTVLANLGPRIPVNMQLVGSVETDVQEEVETVGINSISVSLFIYVEADVQVIIPLATEVKSVSTKILVDKKIIMGEVPEFYGGSENGPSISVPKEDFEREE